MDKSEDGGVSGVVPLPSADLIKYRFDHLDKTLENLSGKMDMMNNIFVPRSEVETRLSSLASKISKIQETQAKLKEKDDLQQGAIDANNRNFSRTIAIITVVAVVLGALWWLPTILHR